MSSNISASDLKWTAEEVEEMDANAWAAVETSDIVNAIHAARAVWSVAIETANAEKADADVARRRELEGVQNGNRIRQAAVRSEVKTAWAADVARRELEGIQHGNRLRQTLKKVNVVVKEKEKTDADVIV
uniref:Uncharacterized protein n=1 Tax=viral metagenome TaxID=1070528 RepID=A0A6C0LYG4_9ZZZZ